MKKNQKKDELYDDSWMYILLLATLAILIESLKTYTFCVLEVNISYAVLLLPLSYLLTNYITKKYDYKKSVAAIAISAVIAVCFMAIISFALGKNLFLTNLIGEFCGYVVSQFVNLTIYLFLLNNTKSHVFIIYVNYIFSIIMFMMFYTLLNLDNMLMNNFWQEYFIIIGIGCIISFPLAIVDKKIYRGRDIK